MLSYGATNNWYCDWGCWHTMIKARSNPYPKLNVYFRVKITINDFELETYIENLVVSRNSLPVIIWGALSPSITTVWRVPLLTIVGYWWHLTQKHYRRASIAQWVIIWLWIYFSTMAEASLCVTLTVYVTLTKLYYCLLDTLYYLQDTVYNLCTAY